MKYQEVFDYFNKAYAKFIEIGQKQQRNRGRNEHCGDLNILN